MVITIAHRIESVLENDKVIVMEQGEIVESGHPYRLLVKESDDEEITSEGHFAGIVKSYGDQISRGFLQQAKRKYEEAKMEGR